MQANKAEISFALALLNLTLNFQCDDDFSLDFLRVINIKHLLKTDHHFCKVKICWPLQHTVNSDISKVYEYNLISKTMHRLIVSPSFKRISTKHLDAISIHMNTWISSQHTKFLLLDTDIFPAWFTFVQISPYNVTCVMINDI